MKARRFKISCFIPMFKIEKRILKDNFKLKNFYYFKKAKICFRIMELLNFYFSKNKI